MFSLQNTFWIFLFFQISLVENYSSEIVGAGFYDFFSSDFSSDFWVNTVSSEFLLEQFV